MLREIRRWSTAGEIVAGEVDDPKRAWRFQALRPRE